MSLKAPPPQRKGVATLPRPALLHPLDHQGEADDVDLGLPEAHQADSGRPP